MQELYATSFSISANDFEQEFEAIVDAVGDWAWRGNVSKPDLHKREGTAEAGGYHVSWSRLEAIDDSPRSAFSLRLRHADDQDAGIEWQTTVDVSRHHSHLSLTLRITREAIEFRLSPARLSLRRPGLVPSLLEKHQAHAGSIRLRKSAQLLTVNDIDAFYGDVLRSEGRTLPALVLSVPNGQIYPDVHADRAADELAGLAHVYVLEGHLGWKRLKEMVGPGLFVPPGGVRIYWPGFGTNEDSSRHRFWLRKEILGATAPLSRSLFQMLSRMSVARVPRDLTLQELEDEALQERARQASESNSLAELVPELQDSLKKKEAALSGAEDRMSDLERRNRELEEDLKHQRIAWSQVNQPDDAEDGSARQLEVPSDWDELDILVDDLAGPHFVLSDRARDQCQSDNPYPDAERMWDHLHRLSQAALQFHSQDSEVGDRFSDWIKENHNLDVSMFDGDLSDTTFYFQGVSYSREPHVQVDDFVKPDECGRIYFALDSDNSRLIVDHVGLHL